ncbi:MAG: 4-hydroxy-tetrahydrodipicolinate reductase [Clostridia bacterium]|nr:4-hydroxy-tetrahydrodipicolinate reductase [Clostridia bacterium]
MIKVLICGIGGHMGANVNALVSQEPDAEVVCGVDLHAPETIKVPVYASFKDVKEDVDVVIDFSSPAVLKSELAWAAEKKVPLVLATTGYTEEDLKAIDETSEKTAVFRTANFSLGINLLVKLVKEAASVLGDAFDVEIIEMHHNQKKDAPSGTALMLADSINEVYGGSREYMNGREGQVGKRGNEIGIHAVRGGTIVGEHEVMFAGEDEIITLSHSARSKRVFAAGAVKAAVWMAGKPAGKYDMNDLLGDVL